MLLTWSAFAFKIISTETRHNCVLPAQGFFSENRPCWKFFAIYYINVGLIERRKIYAWLRNVYVPIQLVMHGEIRVCVFEQCNLIDMYISYQMALTGTFFDKFNHM